MGEEVSTDFKSSNGIEISQLVQVLLNFDWFWGSPWGMGGGWMGWGVGGWGGDGERVHPTHMCMHAHTCTHTCIWHHREFPGIPPMGAAICMKLSCLTCACVHACMHMHVHMCGGTPQPPPTPSIHPPPQSCREPKTPKFNKFWTNRDNSILFEDSLPLNIPELI